MRNRVPSNAQPYSPLEYFLLQIPDLSHLRVFGCSASLSIPKKKRGRKFDAVSTRGVFVDCSESTKGWLVAVGNTVHETPSVVFHEDMKGAGDNTNPIVPYHSDVDSDSESEINVAPGLNMHAPAAPAAPLLHPPPEPIPAPEVQPGASEGGTIDDAGSVADTQEEPYVAIVEENAGRPIRTRKQPDFLYLVLWQHRGNLIIQKIYHTC